jgi:hypothetical protein
VKLIEDKKKYAPYVALSHCWGRRQSCITTSETLELYKRGIPWDTIPKTFKDAMQFSLKLGVKYIWIDSLCIIQDRPSDWDIESSKMADVYQNSYLTLAATASSGDSEGCYPEDINDANACEEHLPNDPAISRRIAVRKKLLHWNTAPQTVFQTEYPLLSRAWVFQERLLSPRVLHFCNSELIWECRQGANCECGWFSWDNSPGGDYHRVLQTDQRETFIPTAPFSEITGEIDAAIRLREATVETYRSEWALRTAEFEQWLEHGTVIHGFNHWPLQERRLKQGDIEHTRKLHASAETNVEILQRLKDRYERILHAVQGEKQASEISQQYRKLVEEYSALNLTRPTDRLPALSGLCERVRHLRADYLAGLWSDSIWLDLLWRVDRIRERPEYCRSEDYRRPSWSWVAVKSPVKYWHDIKSLSLGPPPSPNIDTRMTFVALDVRDLRRRPQSFDYKIQLAGKNPYGEVASAFLTVRSYSLVARLKYPYADEPHPGGNGSSYLPLKYTVEIGTGSRSEIPELPLFPDYILSADGPYSVGDLSFVTLLLIHPQVALVLVPARLRPQRPSCSQKTEKEPPKESTGQSAFHHRKSSRYSTLMPWRNRAKQKDPFPSLEDRAPTKTLYPSKELWERIGIVKVSDTLLDLYDVDWMRDAEVKDFTIV